MTENSHVQELDRAVDRLAGVVTELRQVVERMHGLEHAKLSNGAAGGAQPQPKVRLLSGGSDPTLVERFEEELHGAHPNE